jgi:hypothetical protein
MKILRVSISKSIGITIDLVFLVVLLAKANASQCATFKCGKIKQEIEGKEQCVLKESDIKKPIVVGSCSDDGYECSSGSWSNMDQVKNSTCIPKTKPDFADDTRRAGESCTKSSHCIYNKEGSKCSKEGELGYCISALSEGGDCPNAAGGAPGHIYCPTGMY